MLANATIDQSLIWKDEREENSRMKTTFPVTSLWDIEYTGAISDIVVAHTIQDGLRCVRDATLVVFTCQLDMHSHECLYFLEHYTPYCIVADDTFSVNGACGISVECRNGCGTLSLYGYASFKGLSRELFRHPHRLEHVICGTLKGMNFLRQSGTTTVVIRMESLILEGCFEALEFACAHFGQVCVRLALPETSAEEAFYHESMTYAAQMELLEDLRLDYRNMTIALPYVRHEEELADTLASIENNLHMDVALMIEIPLMIYRFKAYCDDFGTFIIGVGDLYALLGAYNRSEIRDEHLMELFACDLIRQYVFPYMRPDMTFFITSETLLKRLDSSGESKAKLVYLAKY